MFLRLDTGCHSIWQRISVSILQYHRNSRRYRTKSALVQANSSPNLMCCIANHNYPCLVCHWCKWFSPSSCISRRNRKMCSMKRLFWGRMPCNLNRLPCGFCSCWGIPSLCRRACHHLPHQYTVDFACMQKRRLANFCQSMRPRHHSAIDGTNIASKSVSCLKYIDMSVRSW